MASDSISKGLQPEILSWKLDLGANFTSNKDVSFKVWAPKCKDIEVQLQDNEKSTLKLNKNEAGYFIGTLSNVEPKTLYKYRVNGGECFPDPVSRFLPEGPQGPTMIVDPNEFKWHDQHWQGIELKGQIIYEMHIGAFTSEGTFDAAAKELEELKRLGITLIELMPVVEFPGRWNFGYDGVSLYAPFHGYGNYNSLKNFIDKAHQLGIGIILDVVFNHFGPTGNNIATFSDDYLSKQQASEWGDLINFDGPSAKEVRQFYINNACYWISEFHFDGLRIDATQDIHDDSCPHILAELSQSVRHAAFPKKIVLIAENEPQDITFVHPAEKNGYGMDGIWNDDFHHSAIVSLKGSREAYFIDYRGLAQEFVSMAKRGFLYQGQSYSWHNNKPRGTFVTDEPAWAFICYLQNHDQISNELKGSRIHSLTNPSLYRVLTALLLLAPQTPLLFMGQEFASSSPFMYFVDYNKDVSNQVSNGRKKYLEQFPSQASAYSSGAYKLMPNVCGEKCFKDSKLDFSERKTNKEIYQLHFDLIKIRQTDPIISCQDRFSIDGAILDPYSFVLRYFEKTGDDRLLLINLRDDRDYSPLAESLLAPCKKGPWEIAWSSDNPCYGGPGIINPIQEGGWRLPAHSAILLKPVES